MASFAVGDAGCRAELPQIRVGVIRHQGETMLSPSHDVVPFLEAQANGRWAVTAFDERDFGGALGAAADFDVIVLGYNATLFTPELRTALEHAPPTAPILLMHQREQACFGFLREELALEVVPLGNNVREVVTPREGTEAFEPLLSWPNPQLTTDRRLAVKAIRGLSFSPDGAWRVAMEASRAAQHVPVLIRTRADHRQRIVACSLLLRPASEPAHGRLLENLLVYCAFGWPEVALVELAGHPAAVGRVRHIEQSMAMWTKRIVRLTVPDPTALPIEAWPLRGVKRIVAPAELSPADIDQLEGAAAWFRRGGELIRVDADGRVVVDARLTDRFIVVRDWAMWFAGLPEQAWLRRLSPARSVLRMLDAIARAGGAGLPPDVRFKVLPSDYADEVARLLASRVRYGNVEETISATAAALDLDGLVGDRALSPFTRRHLRTWLNGQLDGATRSDQLDILRCLADAAPLEKRLAGWADDWLTSDADRRLDALVATRLREAVHACWPDGDEPADLIPEAALAALDGDQVVEDLRRGPLLCADFLAALYSRGPREPGARSPLFDPARYERSVAAAVGHIRAAGLYADGAEVRPVCANTLAILRHLERHPAGLRFLAGRRELPSSAAESVLKEATRARQNEREARRDLPALGLAVLVLGTVTLALALVGLADLWRLSGLTASIRPWWVVVPAVLVPAAALAALRWLALARIEPREERRDLRLGQSVMALAALALALVPATFAWYLGAPDGGVTAFSLTLGPLAGATAFAGLLLVLGRFNLVPDWATQLPGFGGDITSPLAALRQRVSELRQRRR